MSGLIGLLPEILTTANALFVSLAGAGVAAVGGVAAYDKFLSKDPFCRRYPVVGRMMPLIDWAGKFWRSHISSPDRGELPFNRAQQDWIKNTAARPGTNVTAFGSTRDMSVVGTPIFNNSAFPPLDNDAASSEPMIVGPYCREPYTANSVFNISAMSFGAISKVAIQALSKGAESAGCWLNTGEGGLSKYHLEGGADIVFQIGTAKYGVRDEDGNFDPEKLRKLSENPQVKMIELKLSQGAKPGKGGILPGNKVSKEIAETRGIKEGESSISPNRHPEIANINELLDFITELREISGKPVGFKTVIGAEGWLQDLCEEINNRGVESAPDFITVDGGDGGTGAAPMSLMDNVGKPLREALPLLTTTLSQNGLKERVKVVASGKLVTAADVAWALCAGADFVNSARGFMFSLGCVQAMRCHKNTCPAGITTNDPSRQKVLQPLEKSVKVANYCKGLVKEVETIAHSCGVTEPRQLRPEHVDIVQDDGRSVSMATLYPDLRF